MVVYPAAAACGGSGLRAILTAATAARREPSGWSTAQHQQSGVPTSYYRGRGSHSAGPRSRSGDGPRGPPQFNFMWEHSGPSARLIGVCRKFNHGLCTTPCAYNYLHYCQWCGGDHARRDSRGNTTCPSESSGHPRNRGPTSEEKRGPMPPPLGHLGPSGTYGGGMGPRFSSEVCSLRMSRSDRRLQEPSE